MNLRDYKPVSCLAVKTTRVERARFPVIDAHNHLGETFGGGWINRPVGELLAVMDELNIAGLVDLDGGWGEEVLRRHLDKLKGPAGRRFQVFGGVAWDEWKTRGDEFPGWAADRLRRQAAWGAAGLKVWKQFGLNVRDRRGELAAVDDARLDPIWKACAELGLPVMIHVGDPAAFFKPLDGNNERWEELEAHPDWHFPSPPHPPFAAILSGLAGLVERHPAVTFIGAHVGCCAEDLAWVDGLLERCRNFYVDISARVGELGRQPYSARRFFVRHAKRILFGSDFGLNGEAYRLMFRFLESDDEYFDYGPGETPAQGRWRVYGLGLPDEVLAAVYSENARSILRPF